MQAIDNDYQIIELVEKAKDGNKASLGQLVNLFYEDIYFMVYCRTNSRMDAEDLTQGILMQMVKNLARLKDTSRFRSWFFKIAINHVRDFHRKKRWSFFNTTSEMYDFDKEVTDNHNNLENLMMKKEFWKRFHQFAERLSRGEREVFILRFVDHLRIREIGEVLNKSESTIKTNLYRALKKFKQNPELHDLLKGGV